MPPLRNTGRIIAKLSKETWRDTLSDLRNAAWKKLALCICLCCSTTGLIFLAVILVRLAHVKPSSGSACTPDGAFTLFPRSYSYWGQSGFFQITLAFGQLSFELAKFIDITWDVVVGRGGQAVLAAVSWHVFRLYVTTSMEVAATTYSSYRIIFLESDPSIGSIRRLLRDFMVRKGFYSKVATCFMFATMLFTLAFPTLASAMTGYNGAVQAFIQSHKDKNLISFENFQPVLYIIHDGNRINHTSEFVVTDAYILGDPVLDVYEGSPKYYSQCRWDSGTELDFGDGAHPLGRIVNESSTFMEFALGSPTLNISAYYIYDPEQWGYGSPNYSHVENMLWVWSDDIYKYEDVRSGTCQTTGKFQWGFSFIQLFVVDILLLLWSVGTLVLWLRACITMHQRGRTTAVPGEHKATLELAASMTKELASLAKSVDPLSLTETELEAHVKSVKGGNISYPSPIMLNKLVPLRHEIKAWVVREAVWLFELALILIAASFFWKLNYLIELWLVGPVCGLIWSLAVGSTWRSRCFFIFCFMVLSALPIVIWLIHYQISNGHSYRDD